MGFVGRKPTNAPLISSDLGTGIVGSTNIADGTIAIADLSATGTPSSSTFLRGDNAWSSTFTNPTITNYTESVVNIGTVTTSNTISLTSGTVQTATLTASIWYCLGVNLFNMIPIFSC